MLNSHEPTFWQTPIEVYDWGIDVNLKGPFYMAHAAMPYMIKSGGVFICIGSVTGIDGDGLGVDYAVSKSALMDGFVKSIAMGGRTAQHPRMLRCPRAGIDARGHGQYAYSYAPRGPAAGNSGRNNLSGVGQSVVYHRHHAFGGRRARARHKQNVGRKITGQNGGIKKWEILF